MGKSVLSWFSMLFLFFFSSFLEALGILEPEDEEEKAYGAKHRKNSKREIL